MPENNPTVVGIDLGTVYSVIAHLDEDRKPVTITNAEGDITTPSVVLFDKSSVVVGKEAVKAAPLEPDRTVAFAKREMGEERIGRAIEGESLPPEVVQSFVLRKLKQDAELKLGEVKQAVVTVPAFFNEPRRKATQDAGRLAGLDVIDIINEPTAAAIAFGVQHGFLSSKGIAHEPEKILVYDLGGGTFDVTVMAIDGVDFQALATAGDVFLGGVDWDERIVDYVAEAFEEQHGVDFREDESARLRMLQEAEDAKRALTAREEVSVTFKYEGDAIRTTLSREKFEELTADLLDRTRFTAQKVLKEGGLAWDDLTRIILVGGSTRMPMVQQMLAAESGLNPDRSISADEAVAHGAAIYAGLLASSEGGERPRVSVTNVNSHNLGVLGIEPGTGRPRNKVLIPRNSSLPASHRSRFVTHKEGQPTIAVPVIEGGDASGNNATPIGKCVVKDLPPGLVKGTNVFVEFKYTENGRLTVAASLPDVEHEGATMVIERASGLSEEELQAWEQRIEEGLRVGDWPDDDECEDDAPDDDEVADAEPALVDDGEANADHAAKNDDRFDVDEFLLEGVEEQDSQPTVAPDDDELGEFLRGLP